MLEQTKQFDIAFDVHTVRFEFNAFTNTYCKSFNGVRIGLDLPAFP
jgi:hypothetical protein